VVVRCQEIASKEFIFNIFLGSFAPSVLAIPGYALKVPPFPTTLDPRLIDYHRGAFHKLKIITRNKMCKVGDKVKNLKKSQ
jgi:hypothetical protein